MPKIKIDGKEIEISQESYEAFKEQFLKEEKRWVPKLGEEYWFVNTIGIEYQGEWENDYIDNFRLNTGNCFKTENEMEKHLEKLHAIAEVTKYCYDNDLVLDPDWEDFKQSKYSIIYNNENKEINWLRLTCLQDCLVLPYLKSTEACGQVIKEKEDALKIIFNKK